jgi:ATP-dependent DNA ligase
MVAPRTLCTAKIQLEVVTENIIEDGGEGIILRNVGSFYEHGRTSSLIKLKVLAKKGNKRGKLFLLTYLIFPLLGYTSRSRGYCGGKNEKSSKIKTVC